MNRAGRVKGRFRFTTRFPLNEQNFVVLEDSHSKVCIKYSISWRVGVHLNNKNGKWILHAVSSAA